MEAAAALFALLTLAMLVRHAMNGGVIDTSAPTLAEQAIYTLIAIGAGAILVALDMRSPSSVLRIGSLAAGVVSVVLIVAQHFLLLNPLFTDESTGRIPSSTCCSSPICCRRSPPERWRSMRAASGRNGIRRCSGCWRRCSSSSTRRCRSGGCSRASTSAYWAGMGQLETYSYSALWLAMGVGLLVAGVWQKSQVLRIASAVLIAVAVAKVFIFDMSELEGVLRALSFIGLGAVLIGIGLFYQRLLTTGGEARAAAAS